MNIKLITYHKTKAYGPALQAYATWKTLEQQGHFVEFIDYVNKVEATQFKGISLSPASLRYAIKRIVKNAVYRQNENLSNSFDAFLKAFPLTQHCNGLAELNRLEADVFVVGSDQTWNADITQGIDPAFFLDFGKSVLRVSFASSMGSYTFTEKDKQQVTPYLQAFKALSVREQFAKRQIEALIKRPVEVITDPTLWLDGCYWRDVSTKPSRGVAANINPSQYILYYTLSNSQPRFSQEVLTAAKKRLGFPVYNLSSLSIKHPGVDEVITVATPYEFLWLIDNAALVITSSFHGVAFSLNLNTSFWALKPAAGAVRIDELLAQTNLESQVISDSGVQNGVFPPTEVNFDIRANDVLKEKRAYALNWISHALS